MAELREAHLRYLLAICELGRNDPDVGTQAVAKALNCSKTSAIKMMGVLMDMGLLALAGFKVYSKWAAEGFKRFISEHNFQQSNLAGALRRCAIWRDE